MNNLKQTEELTIDATISPERHLTVLSRSEVTRLLDTSQGGLHQLLHNCALAVLNCGNSTDDCMELLDRYPNFSIKVLQEERGIKLALMGAPANAFVDEKCRVFVAPTDIKLSEEDIVQPDVFVVCEIDRIKRTHLEGAPTLVIEVLSPSTAKKDRTIKMNLYAASGVKEYWVVDPDASTVEVFVLESGAYRLAGKYGAGYAAESVVFSGLKIDLTRVFEQEDWGVERGVLLLVKEEREDYE